MFFPCTIIYSTKLHEFLEGNILQGMDHKLGMVELSRFVHFCGFLRTFAGYLCTFAGFGLSRNVLEFCKIFRKKHGSQLQNTMLDIATDRLAAPCQLLVKRSKGPLPRGRNGGGTLTEVVITLYQLSITPHIPQRQRCKDLYIGVSGIQGLLLPQGRLWPPTIKCAAKPISKFMWVDPEPHAGFTQN